MCVQCLHTGDEQLHKCSVYSMIRECRDLCASLGNGHSREPAPFSRKYWKWEASILTVTVLNKWLTITKLMHAALSWYCFSMPKETVKAIRALPLFSGQFVAIECLITWILPPGTLQDPTFLLHAISANIICSFIFGKHFLTKTVRSFDSWNWYLKQLTSWTPSPARSV